MLDRYRSEAGPRLDRFARPFMGWHPNTLSWLSFGLSLAAAGLLAFLHFLPYSSPWVPFLFFDVGALAFVGGFFDAIDGHVARRRSLTSPRGDFLDHVLDRYADTVLLLGLSVSSWVNPYLGLLALASLLLTSYMGTQAQAITGKRIYGGLLGRADRIVLLTLAALFMALVTTWDYFVSGRWAFPLWAHVGGWTLGPWDVVMIYFVVASQATAAYRAVATWRVLGSP